MRRIGDGEGWKMESDPNQPQLVASTAETYSCSISQSRVKEAALRKSLRKDDAGVGSNIALNEGEHERNYFKSMQWSPDGTCLLTNSADNAVRTFVVPTNLLEPHTSPLSLNPYTVQPSPEPIYALTPYPFYCLSDPSTTLILTSPRDLPIRLTNTLSSSGTPAATYPLINPTTEAFTTPSSLLFTPPGTHFFTGSSCLLSLFDTSRPGEGPLTTFPTIPSKRHKLKGGGVGMRGVVSALSFQPGDDNAILAAGTWTRQLALYDAGGMGGTVATWTISEAADTDARIGGAGISQVEWSPCGRYLFVIERASRGVLIYDVRVTGRLVGWLEGRDAETNQRVRVQVVDTGKGTEIWGGGKDGHVRVWNWRGIAGDEEEAKGLIPDRKFAAHGSVVNSVGVHPSGMVVATSSGERRSPGASRQATRDVDENESDSDSESNDSESETDDDDNESESKSQSDDIVSLSSSVTSTQGSALEEISPDNSIKIWKL